MFMTVGWTRTTVNATRPVPVCRLSGSVCYQLQPGLCQRQLRHALCPLGWLLIRHAQLPLCPALPHAVWERASASAVAGCWWVSVLDVTHKPSMSKWNVLKSDSLLWGACIPGVAC